MGKQPLNENMVKTLRKLTADNELHSLLLNLGVDTMLRASDLLLLKVGSVISENGKVKDEVSVFQKKTKRKTIALPLSDHSKKVIKKYLNPLEQDRYIFIGQKRYTGRPISTRQYQRIIKSWMTSLGVDDVNAFSSHSLRKTKSSIIFQKTKNIEACRRLLSHNSVSATSSYLGIEDSDATDLARQYDI